MLILKKQSVDLTKKICKLGPFQSVSRDNKTPAWTGYTEETVSVF